MNDQLSDFIRFISSEKRYSHHTVTAYSEDLRRFILHTQEHLEVEQLEEVDHHDVRSWIISILEDEHLQPSSVNRKISCLRSFFKFLLRTGKLTKNPMARITSLKVGRKLPLFIEVEQMGRLLDEMEFGDGFEGARDRLIIDLLYNTGMRRAELIGLKTTDVDLYRQQLKVLGKRNKERIIPLTPTMINVLEEYLHLRAEQCGTEGALIISDSGTEVTPSFVYRKVNKYLRLVTTIKKKSPHILRHTFATHMLNNGADLNAIKEILGHSSLAATQVYTHNSIEQLSKIHKQAHPRA